MNASWNPALSGLYTPDAVPEILRFNANRNETIARGRSSRRMVGNLGSYFSIFFLTLLGKKPKVRIKDNNT
jgi:hypothetical protein